MNQFEKNTLFANRYQLIEKLGIGGYSEVWKAEDNFANKMLVAIKIFAPDKGLDKSGLELFGKEYTLVFNLNHPNLLKPMHYDVYKDSPYLVLQYCSKGSLYQKIGKLSETEITVFIHQAASALAYLHGQETPIIHQDIKPDNFLIDNNSNYLLADFGISSKIRRTLTRSMGEKASTGTMAYMPPEKFSRERQTIKAGDIFSLGVCIYELLTGDLPFGEHGGVAMLSGAEIPDLPKAFSPQLNELLRSCLAKDAWDRPTAETLMEIANNYKLIGKWNSDKLPIAKEQVAKKQPEITKQPEIKETVQFTVNEYNDEKKKSFLDTFVKYILIFGLLLVIALFSLYYIDMKEPVKEDNVLIETLIQDSISQVEQLRINDSTEAAEQRIIENNVVSEQQISENSNKQIKYGSFTDSRDGKTYKTVKIGKQIWMAENLAYTGNNGFQRQIIDKTDWENSWNHGWCFYNNDESIGKIYGVLYQWEAAKKACPDGWHLPSEAEWNELINYLGGEKIAGGKLKETGLNHWSTPNEGASNLSGFTALPGGYRNNNGTYHDVCISGSWWSYSELGTADAWYRGVSYYLSGVGRYDYNKTYGFSVRCIKD